jgi:hypothetical protein
VVIDYVPHDGPEVAELPLACCRGPAHPNEIVGGAVVHVAVTVGDDGVGKVGLG